MSLSMLLLGNLYLLVSLEAGDVQVIPGTNKRLIVVEKKTTTMPAPSFKGPDVDPIVEMVGQKTKELGELLKTVNRSSATPPDFTFLKQYIDDIRKSLNNRKIHAQIPSPPMPPPPKLDLSDLAKAMKGFSDDLTDAAASSAGPSLADLLKDFLAGAGKHLLDPDPLMPPPQGLRKDMLDDLKGWLDDLKNALNRLINKEPQKGPDTLGLLGNLTGQVNSMLSGIHAALVEKVDPPAPVPQVVPAPYVPNPFPWVGAGIGPAGGGYVGYPPPYYAGDGAMPPSFRAYPRRLHGEMISTSGEDGAANPASGMVTYNEMPRQPVDVGAGMLPQHDVSEDGFPGPPEMPLVGAPPPASPELDKLYSLVASR